MPALEPVVATLVANTEEFTASMEEAKAQMASMADESAVAGDAAGGAFGMGVGGGAKDAEEGLKETETAAKDAGEEAEKSSRKFGVLGNMLGNLPGPLGEVSGKTQEYQKTLDEASQSGGGFLGFIKSIPTPVAVAGAAILAVAGISVDLAAKYQNATNQIAAAEGISTQAAANVGNAFLSTGFDTTMSADKIANAFAAVAGQAKALQGHVLTAKQSLGLMTASIDDAEATGTDLGTTTSAVTGVLQTFQLHVNSATQAANALYVGAEASGQGISGFAGQLDKAKAKLGSLSPSMQEISALLIDLNEHGEKGRVAFSALTTGFQTFLKPSIAVATAIQNQRIALENLPEPLQKLARMYQDGKMTTQEVTNATQKLTTSQAALWKAFASASDAGRLANTTQQKLGVTTVTATGQMAPMLSILSQLHDKLVGLTPAAATAKLAAMGFGTSAAKWVGIIQAGPKVYKEIIDQVTKHSTAQNAAQKATSGLDAELEKLDSGIHDLFVTLGEKLLPEITKFVKWLDDASTDIKKHWTGIGQVFSGVAAVVAGSFDAIGTIIKAAAEFIKGFVALVKGVMSGKWSEVWDGATEIFHSFVTNFLGFIDVLTFGAMSKFTGFFSRALSAWNALPNEIMNGIRGLVGMVASWIESVFSAMLGGAQSGANSVISYIAGLPVRILDLFLGLPSKMFSIGAHLLEGLANGITSMVGSVLGAVGHVASSVLDKLTHPWEMFSPSRKTYKMGVYLMEGLANGITDGAALAHAAMTGASGGLAAAFAPGSASGLAIGGGFGGGGGGAPIILQVTTPFNIDGRTIATAVTKYQLQGARATGNVAGRYAGGSQTGSATGINPNAITR